MHNSNSRFQSILTLFFSIAVLAGPTLSFGQTEGPTGTTDSVPQSTQPPQPPQPDDPKGPTVSGIVFVDGNGDGKFGEGDMPFAGVRVSNGMEFSKTDSNGKYELPLVDDMFVFVVKPTGYRTALNDDNLPKFFYTHKPQGSPKLEYSGSMATGKIPRSVDFPLYKQDEPDNFQIVLFGDPQPRNIQEVDYIAHDIVSELIGNTTLSFGVSLGDLAFDNLDTLKPMNQAIALIGIPWYNVIGNHDINLDAKSRKDVNETFEAIYGPTYYSFDHGQVHFVVLDNIDWKTPANERAGYFANFGEHQLSWLEKDLALISKDQMVVILMHCPLPNTKDKAKLFRLIEERPICVSVSAHQHYHKHLFLDEEDGWKGKEPHHHVINVTISGSWWSGQKDERGIPHTMMADGAPNGYSILTFDENGYRMDFKAAGRPADEQMKIMTSDSVDAKDELEVWVNVYNGSDQSTVFMSVDGVDKIKLEKKLALDPFFVEIYKREQAMNPIPEPKLTKPKASGHLWTGKLPAGLTPGIKLLNVETIDRHGRSFYGQRTFRVTGKTDKN